MLNYKNTMSSSRKYNEDLPTATKTNISGLSPSRLGLSTPKATSGKYEHRFQEAKSDINYMINEMSQKKAANMDAVQRVRGANADALELFSQVYSTPKAGHQRSQQPRQNYEEPADYGEYSAFPNAHEGQGRGYESKPNIQQMSLEEENIELRKALNQQIRENNDLLRRINHLESQNDHLRGRLGMPASKNNLMSTYPSSNTNNAYPSPNANYSNTNIQNQGFTPNQVPQFNYSPHENYMENNMDTMNSEHGRTAKFGMPTSHWNTNSMNSPKSSHNRLPSELLRELQEIKDYDEELRQKTIRLLRSQH